MLLLGVSGVVGVACRHFGYVSGVALCVRCQKVCVLYFRR